MRKEERQGVKEDSNEMLELLSPRMRSSENPIEEGMATHYGILAWRIPWTEEPKGYSPWGLKELDMTEVN